jgi:hypothetical protein
MSNLIENINKLIQETVALRTSSQMPAEDPISKLRKDIIFLRSRIKPEVFRNKTLRSKEIAQE